MKKVNSKELKFEEALDRLENIISTLQNDDLPLEESLEVFKEGVGLVKTCQERLDNTEAKITILLKDNNGNISETLFKSESEK